MTQQSRRSFLSALAGAVPLSVPLALPAAAAPQPRPREKAHDPKAGPDRCDCPACQRWRVESENHGLTCLAIVALERLDAALKRLLGAHCEDGVAGCDVCNDVSRLRYAILYPLSALRCQVIEPDDFTPPPEPPVAADPHEGAVLAMYEALDAVLDLIYGHCDCVGCTACFDADGLVPQLRAGLDLIGGDLPFTDAILRRELLSEERKVTREAGPGWTMPHSEREHHGAADTIVRVREMLDRHQLMAK